MKRVMRKTPLFKPHEVVDVYMHVKFELSGCHTRHCTAMANRAKGVPCGSANTGSTRCTLLLLGAWVGDRFGSRGFGDGFAAAELGLWTVDRLNSDNRGFPVCTPGASAE
jgi:hypothetical protein